jgi:hypothetical protein
MLSNRTTDPFGAHVAVWMAPGEILHLCHEIGVPVIWPSAMFAAPAAVCEADRLQARDRPSTIMRLWLLPRG